MNGTTKYKPRATGRVGSATSSESLRVQLRHGGGRCYGDLGHGVFVKNVRAMLWAIAEQDADKAARLARRVARTADAEMDRAARAKAPECGESR